MDDRLDLLFLGADHLPADGAERIEEAVAVFASESELAPDYVLSGRRRLKLSAASLRKALSPVFEGEQRVLFFERKASPCVEYMFAFVPDSPVGFRMTAQIDYPALDASDSQPSLGAQVLRAVRRLGSLMTPLYGHAHSLADATLVNNPLFVNGEAELRVYEMYWLNLYGPEMVARIGRETLDSMPCASREWLDNGACLFTTSPDPADTLGQAAREAQAAAFVHLRPEQDFAAKLAQLEARSETLRPVTSTFDEDLAPVLERIIDCFDIANRPTETARLNALRPPPVAEWVPASAALPADVDVSKARDRYVNLYAEQLVALLHSKVPGMMQASPDVLPEIDFRFWLEDYPRFFARKDIDDDLVPALGAFVGQMLVEHLGGRWIPRSSLDEASVVIGDRAWLPFLRARHYFADRQSALNYSLTQFYKAAQRARDAA